MAANLVTLNDFKLYSLIEHTDDDSHLAALLEKAEGEICASIGAPPSATTQIDKLNGDGTRTLILSKMPIIAITSVENVPGGVSLDLDDVEIDESGIMYRVDGSTWPCGFRNWKITYTYGYTSGTVPPDVKTAIYQLGRSWYESPDRGVSQVRQGDTSMSFTEFPADVQRVIRRHRHAVV